MAKSEQDTTPPRVFISYSRTGDEHIEWVADLSERLVSDGVDVVLDEWDLEDGHDVNAFMEQMVTDESIKRVIIVSDALYAAKADGRKGGVGTETQIISKQVYQSVDQTKFVPVLRERDEDGNPCLPVYLKSRKYIDFSDIDTEGEAYDQLLRNIFERPKRRKPAIEKPPSHLFVDETTVVTCTQKANRFRGFVTTGKGNPSAAFEDFANEFFNNLDDLRMTFTREEQDTWCERLRENIKLATVHRDAFVDVVKTGAAHMPASQFMPLVVGCLERLLPYQERMEGRGGFDISEDNYKLLCYEFYVYVVASLIKVRKYAEVGQLLSHRYVAPRRFGGSNLEGFGFIGFNSHADSLESMCSQIEGKRRYSVMADLVHDRATRHDIRFTDVMQADILLCLASRGNGWYPRSLIRRGRSGGKSELFLRAVTEEGFQPLKHVLSIRTPHELLQIIESEQVQQIWRAEPFVFADINNGCLNYEELKRCWPPTG